jgi:type II secretory pathway pseudopilin PulG
VQFAGKEETAMLTSDQWIAVIAVLAVLAVAAVVLISSRSGKRRHAGLKRRFGPEYDRAVQQYGSEAKAEKELAARERRVHSQKLRKLNEADRTQFSSDWTNVQARFVDDPSGAVTAADELILQVMLARGYSKSDSDQRIADLSVEHAGSVEHYRAANVLAEANREGRANTEELRQAFVHYRALFADLLEEPKHADRKSQEAYA